MTRLEKAKILGLLDNIDENYFTSHECPDTVKIDTFENCKKQCENDDCEGCWNTEIKEDW